MAEYARGLISLHPAGSAVWWWCFLDFLRLGTLRSIVLGMAVYVLASAVLRLIFLCLAPAGRDHSVVAG